LQYRKIRHKGRFSSRKINKLGSITALRYWLFLIQRITSFYQKVQFVPIFSINSKDFSSRRNDKIKND